MAEAVRAELKRGGVAQGAGQGPQAPTVPLPVMTCGEIVGAPSIRTAIDEAATSLATDYRRNAR